ncbi:MAG TPA: hypothetical protein VLF63_03465 [Patescibacteria group bacterium]|nr:hypothetical protein [Patescibacteria group bacterium]
MSEKHIGTIEDREIERDIIDTVTETRDRDDTALAIKTSKVLLPKYVSSAYRNDPLAHGIMIHILDSAYSLGEPFNISDTSQNLNRVRNFTPYTEVDRG